MPRVVASVEARMGSSRLPGKMMKDVSGKPALHRLLCRLQQCKNLDDIILATTTSPADDVLESLADELNINNYRGSEDDVLHRVVQAQRQAKSEIVVEINGDCILLDPELVDMGVDTFLNNTCDVVSNCRLPGYPMGLGVQVFRLSDLEEVERTVSSQPVREHVSLHFYEHPEQYRIIHLLPPARWRGADYRLQLDYEEDLQLINKIYAELAPVHGDFFGVEPLMSLLREKPQLLQVNQNCRTLAGK